MIALLSRRASMFVLASTRALTLALAGSSALAHDFWIEPSSFAPATGARISIELRVGEHWIGDAVPRNPDKIERFVAVHADGRAEAVQGVDGKSPAGFLRPAQPELIWLAYASRPTAIELAPEKFESYLADEGLEHVIEMRKQSGASGTKARESYSRSVKSLVRVGGAARAAASERPPDRSGASNTSIDRRLGLPLEIFVEKDPSDLKPGEKLPVRLEFEGKPLAHALVRCAPRSHPEHELRARTSDDGRAELELDRVDDWLVRAVHMVPAAAGDHADWRSYWASLTFELADPAARN